MSKGVAALGCLAVILVEASVAPSGWAAPGGAWAGPLALLLLGAYRGWAAAWVLLMALLSADALSIVLANPTDAAVLAERGLPVIVAAALAYSLHTAKRRVAVTGPRS